MLEIEQTAVFQNWLDKLRDARAKGKILSRIQRLKFHNAGDVKPVGSGISELRIHTGKGYRVYYVQRGKGLIVLLCGGDKGSQAKDIATAKKLANNWSR
jgi:putative addiction module killer protein